MQPGTRSTEDANTPTKSAPRHFSDHLLLQPKHTQTTDLGMYWEELAPAMHPKRADGTQCQGLLTCLLYTSPSPRD